MKAFFLPSVKNYYGDWIQETIKFLRITTFYLYLFFTLPVLNIKFTRGYTFFEEAVQVIFRVEASHSVYPSVNSI